MVKIAITLIRFNASCSVLKTGRIVPFIVTEDQGSSKAGFNRAVKTNIHLDETLLYSLSVNIGNTENQS